MATTTDTKHILIVEDEQHLAIGIKYNLEAEGYRVSLAPDGPSALKLVEQDPAAIDLIVLDLMLPGMSGYTVCESLREQGNDVPILMLSARTLTEDRIRGMDVGADQYLEKPFDLDELLAMVRNLLSRRARAPGRATSQKIGNEFEFGRAKINFDTFKVTVDGKSLRLTSMEMKLLRYFIENEGSVITRAQLLDEVWGLSASPTTRTVDNFISRLRRYFEIDRDHPRHFLSVRGTGYRFVSKEEPDEAPG
ncbi:MAG TPA: response regulator transcription factor [Pirellulales bacterium]|nr:response regulator transcription factor [Pirellulales bacterium]